MVVFGETVDPTRPVRAHVTLQGHRAVIQPVLSSCDKDSLHQKPPAFRVVGRISADCICEFDSAFFENHSHRNERQFLDRLPVDSKHTSLVVHEDVNMRGNL